jgi:hypothetical protein
MKSFKFLRKYMFFYCSAVLSLQSCPGRVFQGNLSVRLVKTDQSRLCCPSRLVLDVLSRLSCHGRLKTVLLPPVLSVLSLLSSSGRPVLSFLSQLYYPDCPLWLFFSGCPVPPILSQLSCTVLAFLSLLSCAQHSCLRLSCPPVQSLLLCCHVLAVLSFPTCPG